MSNSRITGDRCIADRFKERFRNIQHEQCWMLTMTPDHDVIDEHLVADGTADSVTILPRTVLRLALLDNAAVFALVHLHPSNDPSPSFDDIYATTCIAVSAAEIGLRLLDHVICTPSGVHFSFDKSGILRDTQPKHQGQEAC